MRAEYCALARIIVNDGKTLRLAMNPAYNKALPIGYAHLAFVPYRDAFSTATRRLPDANASYAIFSAFVVFADKQARIAIFRARLLDHPT
jgi:hypothetical protein